MDERKGQPSWELDPTLEMIMRTRSRAQTAAEVQRACWRIWGKVRIEKDSLDSERHCEYIEKVVTDAVGQLQQRLEKALVNEEKLRNEIAAMKRFNSELKKAVTILSEQQSSLDDQLKESLQQVLALRGQLTGLDGLIGTIIDKVPEDEDGCAMPVETQGRKDSHRR